MRIRKRLWMTSGIVLGILVFMLFALVWTFRESGKARRNVAFVIEIRRVFMETTELRDEYLLRLEDRARQQWSDKTQYIGRLLEQAGERFTDIPERKILESLRNKFDLDIFLFSSLVKYLDETGHPETRFSSLETQRMFSQLIVNAYDQSSATDRLMESAQRKSDAAHKRTIAVVIVLMVFAVLAMVGNSVSINRTLTERIAELREGTEIIGAGDLDHQIAVKGNDELSDLARASNTMAAKLRMSYTSVANLEKEIAERKKSEEALQKSEALLKLDFRTFKPHLTTNL